jgi:hypothetical protein
MKGSRKINFMKKIKSTSKSALPMVATGLKRVGSTAKTVASKSKPIVEKGISGIYGALATGFDFGLNKIKDKKGKTYKKSKSNRRHKKTHRH